MNTHAFRLMMIGLLSVCVVGCVSPTPPRPMQHFDLALETKVGARKAAGPNGKILILDSVSVSNFLNDDRILIRTDGYKVEQSDEYRWLGMPHEMVEDKLYPRLIRSGLFSEVFSKAAPVPADYILNVRLMHLEQRIIEGQSYGYVSIRFELINAQEFSLLWAKEYGKELPVEGGRDMEEVVKVITQCLDAVFIEFLQDVAVNLPK